MWIGLDNLKDVDLGWNEIKEIAPDAFSPLASNLETLNIRHNPLKTVPPTGLKNLRSLFLSECPLEGLGPDALKDYTALETLDVSKCNLTQLQPEAFVNQEKSLKTLHLQRNLLKTIDPKLKRTLDVSKCHLTQLQLEVSVNQEKQGEHSLLLVDIITGHSAQ
ncbi:hypothetical protein GCK32_017838 [Trichostrongylus colubriformis]|uniref:Uncharacterized protein n=1 Tax=Trichostrongylus colubriformis TaxID=6319 RepID=A0AAN8FG23_TRICO